MEMMPSPVRRMFNALSGSKGYHTYYHSASAGAEQDSGGAMTYHHKS